MEVKRHDAPRSFRKKNSREKEIGSTKGHTVKELPQF